MPVDKPEQRELDNQKQILREKIRALDEKRNTYSPIANLPPETLSQVFLIVRDVAESSDGTKPCTGPIGGLESLTSPVTGDLLHWTAQIFGHSFTSDREHASER